MKKFTDLVLYTLLIIHFPLFYYSHNLFDLSPISFVELLAIAFSIGFVIVGISIIFSKIIKKSTSPIAVLIIIFLFFSYRSFYEFFIDNGMEVRHLFLLPIFFIIFIISLKYAPKLSTKLVKVTFTILFVLIITDAFTLFSEYDYDATGEYWSLSTEFESINLEKFPSIIWIQPDEYPSKNALQVIANYDNSLFVDNLKDMGFEIRHNKSNYLVTALSMPSTLNMDYLVQVDQQYSFSTEVSNSKLFQLLRENNFETVHINGAEPGHHIEKIDTYLCKTNILLRHTDFFKTSVLHYILFLLKPIQSDLFSDVTDNRECFFRELGNLENLDSKKRFVLAHVLLPHNPYYMKDENDNLQNIEFRSGHFDVGLFVNNLEILNEKLTYILPNLIKNNPNTIIIIMSDHGFKQLYEKEVSGDNILHMSKFDNFLAIHLPNNYKLDNIESNVNLFRSLLGNTDENIQLIENHQFMECDFEIEKIDSASTHTAKCG